MFFMDFSNCESLQTDLQPSVYKQKINGSRKLQNLSEGGETTDVPIATFWGVPILFQTTNISLLQKYIDNTEIY